MIQNLFTDLPDSRLKGELVDVLASSNEVRIERIVSTSHASPDGFWYDCDQTEWVVVLRGEAELRFEDNTRRRLKPGDHVTIAPHQKHRVGWTSSSEPTIWLAVFY